jgi:hypothetical protein
MRVRECGRSTGGTTQQASTQWPKWQQALQ